MSTLQEIEVAVDALPRLEQEALVKRLSAKLRSPVPEAGSRARRWPVPPPKVSKAESRRVQKRIEAEFGKVELESWK